MDVLLWNGLLCYDLLKHGLNDWLIGVVYGAVYQGRWGGVVGPKTSGPLVKKLKWRWDSSMKTVQQPLLRCGCTSACLPACINIHVAID